MEELFSLGEMFLSDFVAKEDVYAGVRCPVELVFCRRCSLPQLRHTAPQEILYKRQYWFRSSVTRTMRDALLDVVATVEVEAGLRPGDVVIDIGSNDGTLLRCYTARVVRVGVEPATNLAEEGRHGVDVFIDDFWDADAYLERLSGRKAKAVTAIGMIYDTDEPNSFVADVAKVLAPDGIFVAQLMCARQMLAANDVGNFAHEHLFFPTLKSLDTLLNRHGLEIYDVQENAVNGGSYRVLARHARPEFKPCGRAGYFRLAEHKEGLHGREAYLEFYRRAEANRRACMDYLRREHMRGKRIWLLAASTKSSTVLQWFGLDSSIIEGASERSPEKVGKYMAGLGIPIFSEEDARRAKPDLFVSCLFGFRAELLERERDWLEAGGKMVFLLPRLEVVGKEVLGG